MDADKLNAAAKHFAAWETINSTDPNNNYYCKWGFIKGAKWLMSQSLADRLTEEEKEKIKAIYKDYEELETYGEALSDRTAGRMQCFTLEQIFGKELFNEK